MGTGEQVVDDARKEKQGRKGEKKKCVILGRD